MTANRFAVDTYGLDFEARTIEVARQVLADIPSCFRAEYTVRFIGGAPVLLVAFTDEESVRQLQADGAAGIVQTMGTVQAMVAVRLVAVSKSEPLKPGQPMEGDRLRRHIRESVEHYLLKHGIKIAQVMQ